MATSGRTGSPTLCGAVAVTVTLVTLGLCQRERTVAHAGTV